MLTQFRCVCAAISLLQIQGVIGFYIFSAPDFNCRPFEGWGAPEFVGFGQAKGYKNITANV
jgi:hypothetical protein